MMVTPCINLRSLVSSGSFVKWAGVDASLGKCYLLGRVVDFHCLAFRAWLPLHVILLLLS